ncbi:hypothetical protein GSI_06523 [Ganoderma sinense ZZ0214-1]|uniref:RRM domain-containing protein n=1 Tax=Ganoderma sinense ZZ0214-1 TaxID=1077348 RepID=A0A2G8SDI8_9APHY|nr:hypothetical protein GSI_06523 [Ganoderma sinense ZZ0214-1]
MGTGSARVMRTNTFLRQYVNSDQLGEASPASGRPCHQPWPCNHCGSLAAYRARLPPPPLGPCVFILNASSPRCTVCPSPPTTSLNDLRALISIFPSARPKTGMTATIIANATYDPTLQAISPISTNFPVSGLYLSNPRDRDTMHSSPTVTEPPTPSSTVTIRGLSGSPNPNDNIISAMSSLSRASITRSTSRTYRWIEDQQCRLAAPETKDIPFRAAATLEHPYPAFSQISSTSLARGQNDNGGHVDGYEVPKLEVREANERVPTGRDAPVTQEGGRPETPSKTSSPRKSRNLQDIFHAPSPLRNLHLTFASRRHPSAPVTGAQRPHTPESAASTATFRPHARAASHSRGSSLSTVSPFQQRQQLTARADLSEPKPTPPKPSAWKFKQPPVSRPFSPAPDELDDSDNGSPPPRSSTSSNVTQSGSSTAYTGASLDAPRKMYFGSIRSHSSTTIFSTSPSLWSLPTDASHINDPPESTKVLARDREQSSSDGTSMTWKPTPPTNLTNVTSLLTSPRSRRKRKLIISGILPHDDRRFDAVRKWCESFGELNSITRVPNGDLHVDFRKAEVADTVCRLNARVHIAGVGSVCLSWFTGKRP